VHSCTEKCATYLKMYEFCPEIIVCVSSI